MKKRIALFTASLNCGGAERVMITLANNFFKQGYITDLILVEANGPYLKEVEPGVNIISLRSRKAIFSLFPLMLYLRKVRPDIMLSTLPTINIVAVLANKLTRIKTRLFVRVSITASMGERFENRVNERVISLLRRWALKHSENIIAPSAGVADDLVLKLGIQKQKIKIIYNPIDYQKIQTLASESVPFFFDFDPAVRVVLAVGRMNPQKDFATLIKAFALAEQTENSVLLLLGEGGDREQLTKLVTELNLNNKVFMPGIVDNPFAYMKQASVFVLSSKYEGLPNVLLQALATGVPIVSTDCPSGPREILENGRWGCLVPVGDPNKMAKGIIAGLNGNLMIPEPDIIMQKYGIDLITQMYLDAFFN